MAIEDFHIKKIDAEDAHLLSTVALKAYADHYLDLWYDDGKWYMEKYFSEERLLEEINDNNSLFFIAFFKDSPVGFLKLNIKASLERFEDKNSLELERIYLNKEATGNGIGKELIELTIKVAEENSKDLVWLKAMDTSEGPITFYKKMGFEIAGTHRLKHPLMKEELRGMVVMIKNLTGK
ncbi:GNAT family N-acetyltransferase [Segetibacter aerophilus]|uniref:Spermidine/spermine N(1)-acetyltransferase n=1 Tax=Segetibacter aerophilus TaxID=670293 RepID=A0A512BIA6_9BACT|nr:GNAT family N-acetyltransferase [Segetibacter aerophilus]GEO11605.1 spermidine/spermine N(1)-acetyltransferase [Segetibacter aerophilus]